jgi:NAD(P)-dependent dehydrogenase (short-subunit alcohol dehydrogenase family)
MRLPQLGSRSCRQSDGCRQHAEGSDADHAREQGPSSTSPVPGRATAVPGVAYRASKIGIFDMSRSLTQETWKFGIRSCCLCPDDVNMPIMAPKLFVAPRTVTVRRALRDRLIRAEAAHTNLPTPEMTLLLDQNRIAI